MTSAPPELVTEIVDCNVKGAPPLKVGTSAVAVMLVVPVMAVAWTSPELSTSATSMLELDHETAPVQSPSWSITTAPSWTVEGKLGVTPVGGARPILALAPEGQTGPPWLPGQTNSLADVLAATMDRNPSASGPRYGVGLAVGVGLGEGLAEGLTEGLPVGADEEPVLGIPVGMGELPVVAAGPGTGVAPGLGGWPNFSPKMSTGPLHAATAAHRTTATTPGAILRM